MGLLRILLERVLNEDVVRDEDIFDAIKNHKQIFINYDKDLGEKPKSSVKRKADGGRIIRIYCFGETKAGNPCIRVYQPYGDTSSEEPAWKTLRVDRITNWKDTGVVFNEVPPKDKGVRNVKGDKLFRKVYNYPNTNTPAIFRLKLNRWFERDEEELKKSFETPVDRIKREKEEQQNKFKDIRYNPSTHKLELTQGEKPSYVDRSDFIKKDKGEEEDWDKIASRDLGLNKELRDLEAQREADRQKRREMTSQEFASFDDGK